MINLNNNIINKLNNKNVLIGVSGGVDSSVLLDYLYNNKDDLNIKAIEIAHFDHLTRNGKSSEDKEFVKIISEKYKLKIYTRSDSMYDYSKINKISPEEAGRILRHKFFNEILNQKKDFDKWVLALAHTMDDQVETILFRIIRGTGIYGLEGIKEIDRNIIRPFLDISKSELINYAKEFNIEYREDSTNSENIYTRNSIRNELIPFIKSKYNPNFDNALISLSNIASKQNEFVDSKIYKSFSNLDITRKKDYTIFNKNQIDKLDEYELVKILRFEIDRILSNYNFTKSHYDEVIKIIESNKGVEKKLNGLIFYNSFDNFIVRKIKENLKDKDISISIDENNIIYNSYEIIISNIENKQIDDNKILFSHGDKITIRSRKNGDRIFYKNKEVKLKDFLIDKRIDKYDRDLIPVIEYKDEIVLISDIYINKKYIHQNKDNIDDKLKNENKFFINIKEI